MSNLGLYSFGSNLTSQQGFAYFQDYQSEAVTLHE